MIGLLYCVFVCGRVYVGTAKHRARTEQSKKSALAEHLPANNDHVVKFEETEILSSTWLHRETIEIYEYKHSNHLNRMQESLRLNKTWYAALRDYFGYNI